MKCHVVAQPLNSPWPPPSVCPQTVPGQAAMAQHSLVAAGHLQADSALFHPNRDLTANYLPLSPSIWHNKKSHLQLHALGMGHPELSEA